MGAENPNPLDELKSLDQQVDRVTELAELKPIFYRLDEIAKQCSDDFEVQLVVGDIKQHLVNRGTKLKEKQQASPAPPPLPASKPASPPPAPPPVPATVAGPPKTAPAPPPLPQDLKPTVRLMPSGQIPKSPPPAPQPPATPPVIPPTVVIPRTPPAPPPQPSPMVKPGPSAPPVIPPTVAPRTPPAPPPPPSTGSQTFFAATTEHATPPAPTVVLPKPEASAATPPQQPPSQPPRSPLSWKKALWLGALVGFVVSVAMIAFLVNQARKRNPKEPAAATAALIQVDIATTPPGAAVRVTSGQPDGETKCTSNCTMPLAPGNYQVITFLDGYEPVTTPLTVSAGQPASVAVALQPQAQALRILTDLDQGKVVFDDQPPADLQEGQFIIDKVPPGPHTVKVTGKGGDASFTFEIADAKPPAITGPSLPAI